MSSGNSCNTPAAKAETRRKPESTIEGKTEARHAYARRSNKKAKASKAHSVRSIHPENDESQTNTRPAKPAEAQVDESVILRQTQDIVNTKDALPADHQLKICNAVLNYRRKKKEAKEISKEVVTCEEVPDLSEWSTLTCPSRSYLVPGLIFDLKWGMAQYQHSDEVSQKLPTWIQPVSLKRRGLLSDLVANVLTWSKELCQDTVFNPMFDSIFPVVEKTLYVDPILLTKLVGRSMTLAVRDNELSWKSWTARCVSQYYVTHASSGYHAGHSLTLDTEELATLMRSHMQTNALHLNEIGWTRFPVIICVVIALVIAACILKLGSPILKLLLWCLKEPSMSILSCFLSQDQSTYLFDEMKRQRFRAIFQVLALILLIVTVYVIFYMGLRIGIVAFFLLLLLKCGKPFFNLIINVWRNGCTWMSVNSAIRSRSISPRSPVIAQVNSPECLKDLSVGLKPRNTSFPHSSRMSSTLNPSPQDLSAAPTISTSVRSDLCGGGSKITSTDLHAI